MAEKEYIERGALIEEMQDCKYAEPSNDFQRGVNASVDILIAGFKHLPAADVVEVVRCGQCKHWKINPCNLYGGYCRYCDSAKIDHFCGYGERKENNHG